MKSLHVQSEERQQRKSKVLEEEERKKKKRNMEEEQEDGESQTVSAAFKEDLLYSVYQTYCIK